MSTQSSAQFISKSKKIDGTVSIEDRKIRFTTNASSFNDIIWDEYSIKLVKVKHQILIQYTIQKGLTIEVRDPQFIQQVQDQLKLKINSSFMNFFSQRELMAVMAIGLLVIVVGIALLAFVRLGAQNLAGFISIEEEIEIGQEQFEEHFQSKVLKLNSAAQHKWSQLTSRLTDLPQLKNYPWKIYILKSEELNAFALPGGIITFHTALIDRAQTPEEILGVLAHEMAHVTKRHGVKSMTGNYSARILGSIFFGGDATLISAFILTVDSLAELKFNRTQETEADVLGLRYLELAGVDPSGYAKFFERLQKESEISDSTIMKFLSTHPIPKDRIKMVETRAQATEVAEPINFNLTSFKKSLGLEK